MEKLPNWVRWVISLPTSIAAYFVLIGISDFGLMRFADPDSFFFQLTSDFVESTGGVLILLYVFFSTAPTRKVKATTILAIVIIMICTFSMSLVSISDYSFSTPAWRVFLSCILAIATCIAVCVTVKKGEFKL